MQVGFKSRSFSVFFAVFLASYLIQSLLPCPGSGNGKSFKTVSSNASVIIALKNTGNEERKENRPCNMYITDICYMTYISFT